MFQIKNLKVIILAIFLLISAYLLFSPFFIKRTGVAVSSVDPSSICSNVNIGSSITQVSGSIIKTDEDFKNAVGRLKAGEYATMVVNGGPGGCKVVSDGYVGVEVKNVISVPIKLGTDLSGGTVFTLKPENATTVEDLNKTLAILKKRIKFFNLRETEAYQEGNDIKIKSFSDVDLSNLEMKGELKTKILEEIKFENETGRIRIGSDNFPVNLTDNELLINNSVYNTKENFQLQNITFNILNYTNTSAFVTAEIYSNEDVIQIYSQLATVKKNTNTGDYQFSLQVQFASNASERFSSITKGMTASYSLSQQGILDGKLVFYMDDQIMSSVDIPIDFIGKDIPVIIGFGKSQSDATAQLKKVESSLEFGKLPEKLILINSSYFSPSFKQNDIILISSAAMAIVLIALAIAYTRYKKIKIGIYFIGLAAAEIVCVLGVIMLFQRYTAYALPINFPILIGVEIVFFAAIIKFLVRSENSFRKTSLKIQYKYKKLISVLDLTNVVLILMSFATFFIGWPGTGAAIIISLVLDFILIKRVYNDLLKKSFG